MTGRLGGTGSWGGRDSDGDTVQQPLIDTRVSAITGRSSSCYLTPRGSQGHPCSGRLRSPVSSWVVGQGVISPSDNPADTLTSDTARCPDAQQHGREGERAEPGPAPLPTLPLAPAGEPPPTSVGTPVKGSWWPSRCPRCAVTTRIPWGHYFLVDAVLTSGAPSG